MADNQLFRYYLKTKGSKPNFHKKEYYLQQIEEKCLGHLFDLYNYDIIKRCQYIGVKDKNKIKIFEDDIVIVTALLNDHNQRGARDKTRVYFSEGAFCFAPRNYETGTIIKTLLITHSFEIIGNIYNNPKLLEGDKNGI